VEYVKLSLFLLKRGKVTVVKKTINKFKIRKGKSIGSRWKIKSKEFVEWSRAGMYINNRYFIKQITKKNTMDMSGLSAEFFLFEQELDRELIVEKN
jgi:ribosomal protein L5